MTMEPGFEIGTCYACGQGQVFIAKSTAEGRWFVVCEECFTEWPDPESFGARQNATFDKFGRYGLVLREDLSGHPWKRFVENTADLDEP